MRKVILLLLALCAFTGKVWATDITIGASQQSQLPFNPTNIGNDRTITVTATNGLTTVTSAGLFPTAIVGKSGFQVLLEGTQYVVSGVASTSSLTLTTSYAGVGGSVTMTLYKYVLLRIYATASFQPLGASYIVQAGTPGSGNFFKEIAVSIINPGTGNVAYYPSFVLPATTDASITNQAKYVFGFYRTDLSFIAFYACGNITQFSLPTATPTSFTAICAFNSPGGIVPPNNLAYTKAEIDQRIPSCTANQLAYYAAVGNAQACLTLGTGLSITSGTLNSSGGGGGGSPGSPDGSVQYRVNGTTFGGISGVSSNGTSLTATDGNIRATSPWITNSIDDSVGNIIIGLNPTSPTTNYITVGNAASGGAPGIQSTGTDTNIGLQLAAKGTGVITLDVGPVRMQTTARVSTTAVPYLKIVTPADTGLTTGTEAVGANYGGNTSNPPTTVTRQFATGAITTQRENLFTNPTYGFVGASTITTAATVAISAAPVAGTNATITNAYSFWVQAGKSLFADRLETTPTATNAAVRIGSLAGDPSGLSNGDVWYNSSSNKFKCRENGSTIDCISSGTMAIGGSVTSGTVGSVLFVGAGAVLQQDNNNFFWDDTNNRLGLGTTSPTAPIHISDGNGTYIRMNTAGSTSAASITLDGPGNFVRFSVTSTNTSYGVLMQADADPVFNISTTGETTVNQIPRTTASTTPAFTVLTPLDVLASGTTESVLIQFGGDASGAQVTRTLPGSRPALQREFVFTAPDYASFITTTAATVAISGSPSGGTITNRYALFVQAGNSQFAGNVDIDTALNVDGAFTAPSTAQVGTLFVDTQADIATPAGTALVALGVTPSAYTAIAAEMTDVFLDFSRTSTFAAGATVANQRSMRILAPTFDGASARTLTTASTVSISGSPIASTNITITNAYALRIESGRSKFEGRLDTTAGATDAALRIGSVSSDPSTLGNGDIWYNSSSAKFKCRENGSTVDCIGSGGGGTPGGSNTQVQYNNSSSFGGISGFTSDGTNVTAGSGNLRATRPRFITSIDDTNGNELFVITATASAVNEVTFANAATGNRPSFTTSGGDTNIGLDFIQKGNGVVRIQTATASVNSMMRVDQNDGTPRIQFGVHSSSSTNGQITFGNITPSDSNYGFLGDQASTVLHAPGSSATVEMRTNNNFTVPAVHVRSSTNGQTVGVNIAPASIAAQMHILSGATTRVALQVDSIANATADLLGFLLTADDTSTVANLGTFSTRSNGTAATGFGQSLTFQLESSTTNDQNAGRLQVKWIDATHASRLAAIQLGTVNVGSTTFVDRLTVVGDSTFSTLYLGSGTNNATPITGVIQGTDGTGSNIAGAKIQLTGGNSTGTGTPGQVVLSYTTQATGSGSSLNLTDTGQYVIPSTNFTQTSTVTVASSTSLTSLVGTTVGDGVIGAGILRPGRTVVVEINGFFSYTGTPNLSLGLRLDDSSTPTTVLTLTAALGASPGVNTFVTCRFVMTGRTFGTSGTGFAQGGCYPQKASGGGSSAVEFQGGNTATFTEDFTIDQAIIPFVQWGTSDALNTFSVTNIVTTIYN